MTVSQVEPKAPVLARAAAVIVAVSLASLLACSSSDDSDLQEYKGPRLLEDNLDGSIDLVVDGKRSTLPARCDSQVSAMAVRTDDPLGPAITVFYPGPNSSTPDKKGTFVTFDEPRFAYLDTIDQLDVSHDALTGSIEGSGLLYEDSTTAPADVSLKWTCKRPS